MRSREILKSEGRLRQEAIQQNDCVNSRYLMVHNVLAQAFAVDPAGVLNSDLPDYLSRQLNGRTSFASLDSARSETRAA